MIKKKLLVCILLGVSLSACDMTKSSSVGDDANPNTNGNGAYVNQESTMVLSAGKNSSQSAKVAPLITTLLTMGVKAAASSLGTSVGKGVLAKFLGDPNQKMYDRFDQVDKKLAEINVNMKEQLKLSNDTLNLLSSLILDQDKEWLNTKVTAIHNALKPIRERDNKFETGNIYGDLDSTDLDKIYSYVQTHKDYQTLVDAGIVNANLIDPEGAKNLPGLTFDGKSTKELYSDFQDEFINNVNNVGNAVNSFKNIKTNLLAKLTELGLLDGKDMIGYINAYNYNIMDIRLQILSALQKLYNMQLVQLAYYYGVKGNLDFKFISSDPANPMPAQSQGLEGFKKGTQLLFNTYEADLNNLNKAFESYMPFITETSLTVAINHDWFSFNQTLLLDRTFLHSVDENAPLPLSERQCEVTSLTFNSIGDSLKKYGLVNLGIKCYLGNGTWKASNVVFPAVKDGTKIVRYAYYNIYATSSQKLSVGSLATAPRQLTPDDIKAFAEQTSSKDSIKDGNINGLVDADSGGYAYDWIKKGAGKKDMVLFSPAKVGSSGIDWAAGDFELNDSGSTITRILPVTYYDGNKGENPAHLRRAQTDRTHSINGETIYNMRFSQELDVKDGRFRGTDPITYFYNLASYRNHWFVIKMSMGYDNKRAVQALGIGCIDSLCSRASNTSLKWISGAEVKLTPPTLKNNAPINKHNYDGEEYQTQITGTGN